MMTGFSSTIIVLLCWAVEGSSSSEDVDLVDVTLRTSLVQELDDEQQQQ